MMFHTLFNRVWLGQIGIGVEMICSAKTSYTTATSTKNRSGDDASFFQEKRLTYGSSVQISKTLGDWATDVVVWFDNDNLRYDII